jgi:hypothetical protein
MSVYGTIKYYESVIDHDPTASEDVRLFLRPGVAHCISGPGPDVTDYLAAIDEWVESGKAKDTHIEADTCNSTQRTVMDDISSSLGLSKFQLCWSFFATALSDMLFRDLSRDIAFLHNQGIYRD